MLPLFVIICSHVLSSKIVAHIGRSVKRFLKKKHSVYRGHFSYQPKQYNIIGEIPQNYHTFVLLDPSKIGNLMTPDIVGGNFEDSSDSQPRKNGGPCECHI